jgi:ATP-dependent DNA ligase
VHEAKLDGFRCLAQVRSSRLRLWSRAGGEWVDRLPELDGVSSVGEVVLDGEVVVLTADGRADFKVLATVFMVVAITPTTSRSRSSSSMSSSSPAGT